MPVTTSVTTGGNVSNASKPNKNPYVEWSATLPDSFTSTSVSLSGVLIPVLADNHTLGSASVMTGFPLAIPAVPSSGNSLVWVIEVNLSTGAATIKTGSTATTGQQVTPAADAGNLVIASHTITNGDTIPWLRALQPVDLN